MSKLIEKREELHAKQKGLAAIFEAYPDLNMSAEVAEDVKRRNDELTDIGKEYEQLVELDRVQAAVKEAQKLMTEPTTRMIHPDAKVTPQTLHSDPENGSGNYKSIGDLFVESEAFTGWRAASKSGPAAEIKLPAGWLNGAESKTLLTQTGYAPQAVRTNVLLPGLLERPRVADLIPQGTTDQISIVYMEETTTTNAAAFVAEGGSKPESALAFTERSSAVRKIATVLPVTDELMADVPAMRSYVEARLRIFLAMAEDAALLTGSGTPPAFYGLLNTANIQTQAKGADPTPDAVYKAMVKIQTAFLEPSGVVFNPLDWQDVRLLRTADGLYIWGAPMDAGPERIWGLPVVTTTSMTQNTALVGAFDTATQIFRREGVTFAISTEHSDFFIKNQMMLRVEMREALVVYRPTGLCTVTGV